MGDTHLGVAVGDLFSYGRAVDEGLIERFAEVSGDVNPLHLDPAYAARTRFGERIAHGVLSVGFISAVIGNELGGPERNVVYLSQSVRFLRPVKIGDTITATIEVTRLDAERGRLSLATRCARADGKPVIEGEAEVLLEALS